MTKEEIQAKSQEKMKAIESLCKQLEISVSAEQIVTKEGFIKNIVYYNDMEKYDVEDNKTNE